MALVLNDQLGTARVAWNLHFLYQDEHDALLTDMAWCRGEAKRLAARYSGKVAGLDAAELAVLLRELEDLDEKLGRLESFSFLSFITQTDNAAASALLQQTEELAAEIGRDTIFFRVEWNLVEEARSGVLMAAQELASPLWSSRL